MKKSYLLITMMLLTGLAACSRDQVAAPTLPLNDKSVDVDFQNGRTPPGGLVTVSVAGVEVICWPFTGSSFNGVGVDPINLVFTGHAGPMQIREALLALDGDRSALGLPPAYPFNQQWHDALGGGVQTSFSKEGGWLGSVIQLTLGDYEPVRFHLRLFRTDDVTPDGQPITLGAAHFEVLIPGTSEHQVLSWEVAEQIVTGDLMRSGLLDPALHIGQTGQINDAPGWRLIDPSIYNGLPAELIVLIGGPAQPQSDPVPIATDGRATTIHLAGARPVTPMTYATTAHIGFGQFIPRPFCSTGPADWLHITGGVEFYTNVLVDSTGRFSYEGGYRGVIEATPVDISSGQPAGEMFTADVRGKQHGWLTRAGSRVQADDRKLSHESGGAQIEDIALQVSERGGNLYKALYRCLDAE
jgi:hypothetical protein